MSSDSGFSTKSNAPSLIARTADSMLPWPEISTTCASTCRSRSRASVARPSMPGQPDVEHDQIDGAARQALEARLAARHGLDGVALVAQHAAQRGADAGLVVDDQDGRFHAVTASHGLRAVADDSGCNLVASADLPVSQRSSARQLDCKARAARRVVADLDAAAVLGDDAAHDRQAEAAAAPLRRVVRQEQLLALGRRNARAVVGDDDADDAVGAVELRFDDDLGRGAPSPRSRCRRG